MSSKNLLQALISTCIAFLIFMPSPAVHAKSKHKTIKATKAKTAKKATTLNVEINQELLCSDHTTEMGADEIYILVEGRRTDGQTFKERIPGPNHWDMNDNPKLPVDNPSGDSHCVRNKSLFMGELPEGQSWDVVLVTMEEDGGNSKNWQTAISDAAIESDTPFGIVAGGILAAYTKAFGAIINDTDDYIGSVAVHLTNKSGKIGISWRKIDRVTALFWREKKYNDYEAHFNGDGSDYKCWYEIRSQKQ